MIHVLKDLKGLSIETMDEPVGEVTDVLFDDLALTLRYFVIRTGSWLKGRDVLISPLAVKEVHPESGNLICRLTKKEIEASPPLASHLPVSRQYEEALGKHYSWTPYWGMPINPTFGAYGMMVPSAEAEWHSIPPVTREQLERSRSGDPHLRSATAVEDYALRATDGEVGHLKDLLVDDTKWQIKFLVVGTGHWLSRRTVVIDPTWVSRFDWAERDIVVSLTRQDIERAPAYDPDALGATFESDLTIYFKGLLERWKQNIKAIGPDRGRGDDQAAGHP